MQHLDSLNPAQKQAAAHKNGPLLIIAGAGAGKTKTLTHRILELVNQGIPAERILAITFTNKAAAEMKERVEKLIAANPTEDQIWGGSVATGMPFVSTFHSLGVYMLRQHGSHLGLNKFFSILDRDESISLVKKALRALDVDEKRFEPRKVLSAISKQKGDGVALSAFYEQSQRSFFPKIVAAVWQRYEAMLKEQGALDFDDLLAKTVELLERYEDVRQYYQGRWQYIHIDEYQDTNAIQYRLSRILSSKHSNICVVGDIDQSIYSWRGADYTNILNFEKDYPSATVVLLEQNYRSTKTILAAANEIIKKNNRRREKNLFTDNHDGEKITLNASFDEGDEARFVARTSCDLIKEGENPQDIAVLYRANFQSRILEEAFLKASVPYQVLGVRFLERREIKDIVAYIKAALNPQDFESFKRALGTPSRGIGKVSLDKIAAGKETELPAKMQEKLANFRDLLGRIKEGSEKLQPSELIKYILEASGLEAELKNDGEEGTERLENIQEFVTVATKYDNMPVEEGSDLSPNEAGILALVTEATLVSDQDSLTDNQGGVRLMTVHASKGLEFKYVFIVGLEHDLFPHGGMGGDDEKRDDEEERRLFYVALTRAKHKLFLSYAQMRTIFGSKKINMPSEFIADIGDELMEGIVGARDPFGEQSTSYIDF